MAAHVSVSVVIPTKDRLSSLRRVLPTYLSQPEVEEIIVVVDGSTDGTMTYLRDLASANHKIRCIDNGVNRGIRYSKNAGISARTTWSSPTGSFERSSIT